MAAGSTGILKYFRPVGSSSSSITPILPDPDGPLSERVATGTLYIYGRVYFTFTRKFTDGHGVMCTCTVLVTLGEWLFFAL